MNIVNEGKKVFDIEIESLLEIKRTLNGDFEDLVKRIGNCEGRVIITGMGKSGHVARKIAATMSSLGTPTFFLHPAEGLHGDLGRVTKNDIIIAISNSGETDEVIGLLPSIKTIGAMLVSITGKRNSTLEENSDLSIVLPIKQEASPNNLAPTTSTTATLVFGDALAVVLAKMNNFKPENFALFHPNGSLGKRLLLKVKNIMHMNDENPVIEVEKSLKDAILVMSSQGLGAVTIIDEEMRIQGLITDGDIRRTIEKHGEKIFGMKVNQIMTEKPIKINENELVVTALEVMENREKQLMVLPVVNDEDEVTGMIRIHDIIKAGVSL